MPVFLQKQDRFLVLTSYKVMYSSLMASDDLLYLGDHIPLRLLLRMRLRYRGARVLYLARNPFDRIASFYRDKFQQQPRRIEDPAFEWQHCHRIFYQALGLEADDDNETIAERFMATEFTDFVHMLPEHWAQDLHLHPQWCVRRVIWGSHALFLARPDRAYAIETGLAEFWSDSGLAPERKNRTSSRQRVHSYTAETAAIVSELYSRDFEDLGYRSDPAQAEPLSTPSVEQS